MIKVQCLSIVDTLEHMVGETFVILYVHPLIFLRFFLSLQKFFNINEYIDEIIFI